MCLSAKPSISLLQSSKVLWARFYKHLVPRGRKPKATETETAFLASLWRHQNNRYATADGSVPAAKA